MARILDGKIIKQARQEALKKAFAKLSFVPTLAIIQVGRREDSTAYVEGKKKCGEEIGAKVDHIIFSEDALEQKIIDKIKVLNNDKNIQGIIVQLPLPAGIDRDRVIDAILPSKDVDGLTAKNLKYLFEGREDGFIPATTVGILNLLKFYEIPLEGKKVTIVGRSTLVGKPTFLAFLNENATATICHSHTENLSEFTCTADILVVAIGKPSFIHREHVREGQIVIDVGINSLDRKLVGDVDFKDVENIVSAITPVPGGVGPMTVVSLFENLLKACTM